MNTRNKNLTRKMVESAIGNWEPVSKFILHGDKTISIQLNMSAENVSRATVPAIAKLIVDKLNELNEVHYDYCIVSSNALTGALELQPWVHSKRFIRLNEIDSRVAKIQEELRMQLSIPEVDRLINEMRDLYHERVWVRGGMTE